MGESQLPAHPATIIKLTIILSGQSSVSSRHVEILNVMPYVYGAVAFIGVVAVVFICLVALGRALG